jgi:predicted Na+-dependent transporter
MSVFLLRRWLQQDPAEEEENNDDDTLTTSERIVAIVSEVLLFFMIFGLSASVETKQFKHQIHNYKSWITGSALQFVFMPLMGFLSVQIFDLPVSTGLALLIITSSPGGTLSNWWCATFNADLALSVTLTALSSLLAIAFMPLNLLLYTNLAYKNENTDTTAVESLEIGKLGISLAIIVGAIVSGTGAAFYWDSPRIRVMCYHVASGIGVVLIVLAFWVNSQGTGENTKVWNQEPSMYIATAIPCWMGMMAANGAAWAFRFSGPQRVTLSIEVGYQNTLVAISVLIRMFENDTDELAKAVAVPIFYGVTAAITTLLYVLTSWKLGHTKAPRNDPIWKVITHMYEEEDDHPNHAITNGEPSKDDDDDCPDDPTTTEERQMEIIQPTSSDEATGYALDTRP